jgi:hypothetical protein
VERESTAVHGALPRLIPTLAVQSREFPIVAGLPVSLVCFCGIHLCVPQMSALPRMSRCRMSSRERAPSAHIARRTATAPAIRREIRASHPDGVREHKMFRYDRRTCGTRTARPTRGTLLDISHQGTRNRLTADVSQILRISRTLPYPVEAAPLAIPRRVARFDFAPWHCPSRRSAVQLVQGHALCLPLAIDAVGRRFSGTSRVAVH